VVVDDGDGAGVERDGAFAVVALGVTLPDDDAVGDGHGLTDREPCPVKLEVAPSQRERFGPSQAGGGDEEPQGVVTVAAGAAVVEEGDELVAGPAVVAGVAGSGASGLGWVGKVGDVAGQVAAGEVTAGDNPERLRSEGAFARLTGTAPIPASSGQTNRFRPSRSGDRQANAALHLIAVNRLLCDPRSRAYVTKRTGGTKANLDILRRLKRYTARELYPLIVEALTDAEPDLVPAA
jgi:hypothetical protein